MKANVDRIFFKKHELKKGNNERKYMFNGKGLLEMSYQSLDRKSKMSFQKILQYYLEEFLESNHYEAAKVDFVTDLFIGKLRAEIIEGLDGDGLYRYTNWAMTGYRPEKGELKTLMQQKVANARKKKLTEKQITYFHSLTKVCNVDQPLPDDALIFSYEINRLKHEASKVEPATEKQKKALRKLWSTVVDEIVEIKDDLTKHEAHELFEKFNKQNWALLEQKVEIRKTADIISFPFKDRGDIEQTR